MADPRCHDFCPDCGKVCYQSIEQAKIAAAQQGRRRARAYRCGSSWHLTRWSAEAYETHGDSGAAQVTEARDG